MLSPPTQSVSSDADCGNTEERESGWLGCGIEKIGVVTALARDLPVLLMEMALGIARSHELVP